SCRRRTRPRRRRSRNAPGSTSAGTRRTRPRRWRAMRSRPRIRACRTSPSAFERAPSGAAVSYSRRSKKAREHERTDLGGASPPKLSRVQAARDAGLSRDQKREALRLAQIPEAEFEAAINSDHPPTAAALAARGKRPAPLVDLNRHFPDRPVSGSGYRPPDLV